MLLVKTSNGQVEQFPYTLGDFRRDNPQTSFPKDIPVEILNSYSVYPVTELTKPDYDPLVQSILRDAMPELEANSNEWQVGYTVESKPQDEAERNVRSKRDQLLAETDWMALSDVTMSSEMTTYRQALRDITDQEGFPYSVTWPTKP